MPNERLIMDVNNSCRAFLAKLFFFPGWGWRDGRVYMNAPVE